MGSGTSKTTKQQRMVRKMSFLDDNYPDTYPQERSLHDNSSYVYSATPDRGRHSPRTQYGYASVEQDDYPIPGSACHAWWSQTDLRDCSFPREHSQHTSCRSPMPVSDITRIDAFGNACSCNDQLSACTHKSFEVKGTNTSQTRSLLTGNVSYADTGGHSIIDTRDPVNRPKAAKRSRSAIGTLEKYKNSDNTFTNSKTRDVDNDGSSHRNQDDRDEAVDLVQLVTRLLRENQVISGRFDNFEEMQNCSQDSKFTVKVSVRPNSQVCEIILPEAMFFASNPSTIH